MGVLRFVWSGVLAFDRIGSRFYYLVQVWLCDLFIVMPFAFFFGRIIDNHGCCGVAGTGAGIDGTYWGCFVVGLGFLALLVRGLVRSRDVDGFVSSHPSYGLLLLITLPIPLLMVLVTVNDGDSLFYMRAYGIAGLVTIGALFVLRVIGWLVFGRRSPSTLTPRESWTEVWQPVIALVVLLYAIGGIPFGLMTWQEHRTIENLPLATTQSNERGRVYVRVEGRVVGEPVRWAPGGTGRGGNNYAGIGVLVALDAGGEVLLLADSLSVPDLTGDLEDVEDGRISSFGETFTAISEDQQTYYGFDQDDFPPPDPAGRVLVLRSYP